MIRYTISTAEIRDRVDKYRPRWRERARQRTLDHQAVGRYIKKGDLLPSGQVAREFWHQIKDIFIKIQSCKCIYCEISLEGREIQWDIEHFRPKDRVDEWKAWPILTGPSMPEGYYLLAYDLENYAVACKVCNTVLKQSYFPIANSRVLHGTSVVAHASEEAYLLYPLGDAADDPEQYIEFYGVTAKSKNNSDRGRICIQLLDLNREELQIARSRWLVDTFLNAFDGFLDNKPRAVRTMKYLLSDKAPHANCTRCFYRLCLADSERANALYDEVNYHPLKGVACEE